jgi:MoxR-like ATPase
MEKESNLLKSLQMVDSIIRGKSRLIKLSFAALLAGGHILFEDLPGTGKTTLSIAMSRALGCNFTRVQCTNDLMPSDILGTEVFISTEGRFTFREGPIFTNILLADEINRATPRAQSALLEAMGEGRVSLGGKTTKLPEPFFVIATQNPMDLYGTFPLPESQLDRFMMRLEVGYPSRTDEAEIIADSGHYYRARDLSMIMSPKEVLGLQDKVDKIKVSQKIVEYLLNIAELSRKEKEFKFGLSPRGVIALKKAAQAWAFLDRRGYVIPDDIKDVFRAVTFHRLYPPGELNAKGRKEYLDNFLQKVVVPL